MDAPAARPVRSASVLLPTYRAMEFLERMLDALAGQESALEWDLHVVDSSSDDGTWELLNERAAGFPAPMHLRQIPKVEFDHGDTRNELAAGSPGELLVFMTQDAVPSRSDWLATLARDFDDPRVGAAYCRNVHRPDARVLTRVFTREDPGYRTERVEQRLPAADALARLSPHERRLLYNFNDVASAVRRELWERHPFPRTMMGEDVLMGRAILDAGHTIVYDAEATVDHSHDYGPEQLRWRGGVDARFNAEWLDRIAVASRADLEALLEELLEGDARLLAEAGHAGAELEALLAEARTLRRAYLEGAYEGGRSTRRYPLTKMRERKELRVLLATSAFPPECAPGEVGERVRAAALELARRGHRVTVLALSPPTDDGGARVWREEEGELALVRARRPAEAAALDAMLRAVLACEAPELVHVHERGGGELALLRAARDARVPSVVSVYDDAALRAGRGAALAELGLADLRIAHEVELRAAFLDAADLDPQTFVYTPPSALAPGPEEKPIGLEAAQLEFRYRALGNVERGARGERPLFRATGAEARVVGAAEAQGSGWLLVRPGGAAEYALPEGLSGAVTLEVEQRLVGGERGIALGGRALLDGRRVGELKPVFPEERDRDVRSSLALELPEGASTLRLEPAIEGSGLGLHLRLCRVSLLRRRPDEARLHRAAAPPPADLAELAEELRVEPGPQVAERDLPRVAVVIPHLDGLRALNACLKRVRDQRYPREKVEVVVVDNGSSDGSRLLVRKRFPWARLLPQGRNLGFAAACNAGARAATEADVLVFLNDDVFCQPELLRELAAPLARRECAATTAKLLSLDGRAIDTSGTGASFLGIAVQPGYGEPPRPVHDVPRRTLFGCGGAMAIDREVFEDVGGFDEAFFAYYEDLDLGWRLWLLGHEVHYVPTAVGVHAHSATSARFPPEAVRVAMVRNSLYTCVKNYDDESLARVLPAMLALAVRRARLGAHLDERPFRIERCAAGVKPLGRLLRRLTPWGADTVRIGRLGAADLIALDDLLGDWDAWMARRARIQSRRVRSDAELQRLFVDPLACVEADPAYAALQRSLVAMYGLEQRFRRR